LADPSRRVIVERLGTGPATVSELARPLSMTLPSVVQHIHVLESSGLVRSKKTGRVRTCQLNREILDEAGLWFAAQRKLWNSRLDNLGEYLESLDNQDNR
jgi:DNA-binding transcriptional ArsR family regulator